MGAQTLLYISVIIALAVHGASHAEDVLANPVIAVDVSDQSELDAEPGPTSELIEQTPPPTDEASATSHESDESDDAASHAVSETAQIASGEQALLPPSPLEQLQLGVGGDGALSADPETASTFDGGIVRTVVALGGIIALILGIRWLSVRAARGMGGLRGQLGAGGRSPSGLLVVLGRYPVARGQTLVLLKLDRRVLLLCQNSSGFSPLAEVTDPEDVASILTQARDDEGESLSNRFNALLKSVERDPASASTEDLMVEPSPPEVVEPKPMPVEPRWSEAVDGETELRRRIESLRGLGR
ncbi:MAG: flagellar biosynthetic protein FliO [Planctomycetota bacterium]